MRCNGKHGSGASSAGALVRAGRLLIAFMLVAVPLQSGGWCIMSCLTNVIFDPQFAKECK